MQEIRPVKTGVWQGIREYYCKHPFDNTIKIYQIVVEERVVPHPSGNFIYVVNVRKCNFCKKYFIDEGYEPEEYSRKERKHSA